MANEKRLIDAGDLWSDIMMLPHNGDMISSEEVEQAIMDSPTVDAGEVVRCKGCKLEGTEKCPMVHRDLLFGNLYAETKPDAFCSYGARRTDERKVD